MKKNFVWPSSPSKRKEDLQHILATRGENCCFYKEIPPVVSSHKVQAGIQTEKKQQKIQVTIAEQISNNNKSWRSRSNSEEEKKKVTPQQS